LCLRGLKLFLLLKVEDRDDKNSNHIFVVENTDCSTQSINVFDISGMWIQHIMDKDIDSNSFSRQIGNVCFHINRNGIYKKDIKFPHIYPNKVSGWLNRLTQPNHKIGTLDIETYNIEKVAYAYAIGFYVQGDLQCFYTDKNTLYYYLKLINTLN